MKKLLFLLLLLSANVTMAQPPNYDDLLMLFTDENWEKLIKESEKYTMKEDTKSDPLAHMWLAKGLYYMSLSGTDDEDYKSAYKDAITSMGKVIKLDKSGDIQDDQAVFIETFKMDLVERIENEMSTPKKAAGWITKYYKFEPAFIGAKYLEGACKYLDADKASANILWKEGEAALKDLTVDNFNKDFGMSDKQLFLMGILKTVECYNASKQLDKAKTLLGKTAQFYIENADLANDPNSEDDVKKADDLKAQFKEVYDNVVN